MTNLSKRNRYILAYVACLLGVSYFLPPHVRSQLYKSLAIQAVVIAILGLYHYQRNRGVNPTKTQAEERYKANLAPKQKIKKVTKALQAKIRTKVKEEGEAFRNQTQHLNKESTSTPHDP